MTIEFKSHLTGRVLTVELILSEQQEQWFETKQFDLFHESLPVEVQMLLETGFYIPEYETIFGRLKMQ